MTPLLRLEGISKRYGGVRALAGARLECGRGRIHAVLGENGAGKSTLIKVLAGVVKPDAGTIELEGKPIVLASPAAANRAGIVSVFQELSLLPDLTVADNIGIIDPPKKWGMIDQRAQRRLAEEALAISIRSLGSAIWRFRAVRWWRSPRPSPAIRSSSSSTRRRRR